MQVLYRNVKKLFKISMSSRHEILFQLKTLLMEDKSRYYIIRTDVCHCFESIPHDKLFKYLEGNNLLDVKRNPSCADSFEKSLKTRTYAHLYRLHKLVFHEVVLSVRYYLNSICPRLMRCLDVNYQE